MIRDGYEQQHALSGCKGARETENTDEVMIKLVYRDIEFICGH